MRASKLLTREKHTFGPHGWQGTLTREDAEEIGGYLCQGFANDAPRGTTRHRRLVSVLCDAIEKGSTYVALEEARTLMSAYRLTYAGRLDGAPTDATLETGVKVYPKRSVKQRLMAAFNRTFPKGNIFDIEEVAV